MATGPSRADELTLTIGEALVDIVVSAGGRVADHVGGSPANVALGLARLGHAVELATHIAADGPGDQIRRHLEGDGVRLTDGSVSADRTPTATAHLDERGAATYTFDISWDLPDSLGPGAATHVHIGSIGAMLLPGADQVRRIVGEARDHTTISFDPNLRPVLLGDADHERPRIEQLVAMSDLVKASDEDIAWLYPGDSVDEVLARWSGLGPSMTVATLGGDGARALVGGAYLSVPPEPVTVVDTVGAGDSFMAALISGLLDAELIAGPAGRRALSDANSDAVRPALDRAIHVAAITCSRAGANPPYRREL